MKTRTIGKTTTIRIAYLEWVEMKGVLPEPETLIVGGRIKHIITNVPEDKREFFEKSGLDFRLAAKAIGTRRPY
jgi:hypothetical protein